MAYVPDEAIFMRLLCFRPSSGFKVHWVKNSKYLLWPPSPLWPGPWLLILCCSPLGLYALFHFLKVAPSPFLSCFGLVSTRSVTRDRNAIQTGLSLEENVLAGLYNRKVSEKAGFGSGRLWSPLVAFSLCYIYYLHSQSSPKGCEAVPQLASWLATLVEGVLSLPPSSKGPVVNPQCISWGHMTTPELITVSRIG